MLRYFVVLCFASLAGAQSGLTSISYSGGGQITYGPLPGETTLDNEMISMLRSVHQHFGERPKIGKFYQARGSNSMATFFELTGKRPIRGMILVTAGNGAVLFDDAARFGSNWSGMLNRLNEAWNQPASTPSAVPALHTVRFPDNSGTIGLPDEWRIVRASNGSVTAAGPHGELVGAGNIWQIYDSSSQQGRGLIQYMTNQGRKPMPAGSAIAPYCDLVRAWVAAQQTQSRNAQFRLISQTRMQNPNGVLVTGELDRQDGSGPMMTRLQLTMLGSPQSGTYGLGVFRLSGPAQEMPTLQAIARSLNQNGQMIGQEIGREIANNNAQAEAGRRIADQKAQQNYQHTRDVEQASAEQAKRNQAVDNYILDKTVIEHIDSGAHGTTAYALADVLVTRFPDRFRYVPTQDFIKGVDF